MLEDHASTNVHIWTLDEFEYKMNNFKAGQCIKSNVFHIDYAQWYFLLFPNGRSEESKNSVSITLSKKCIPVGAEKHAIDTFKENESIRWEVSIKSEPFQKVTSIKPGQMYDLSSHDNIYEKKLLEDGKLNLIIQTMPADSQIQVLLNENSPTVKTELTLQRTEVNCNFLGQTKNVAVKTSYNNVLLSSRDPLSNRYRGKGSKPTFISPKQVNPESYISTTIKTPNNIKTYSSGRSLKTITKVCPDTKSYEPFVPTKDFNPLIDLPPPESSEPASASGKTVGELLNICLLYTSDAADE